MGETENEKLFKSLQRYIQRRDTEKIKTLIQSPKFDVNERDLAENLQTPLMTLCHCEIHDKYLLEIIDLLVERNADLNLQDSLGRTAVMHALIARRSTLADYLISDPTTRLEIFDFDGNSVLSHAVKSIDCIMTKRILEHPAGIGLLEIYNSNGQKPLHISIKIGNKKLIKLIEHYEAKIPKAKVKEKQRNLENDSMDALYSPRTKKKLVKRSSDNSLHLKLDAPSTGSEEDDGAMSNSARQNRSKKCINTVFSPDLILPSISEKSEKSSASKNTPSMRRKARRNSVSLPDLRDTPNCLIRSGENTPSNEQSDAEFIDDETFVISSLSPRKKPPPEIRKCISENQLSFPSIATKNVKSNQVKRTLTESSIYSNSDDALSRTMQRLL